MENLLNIDIALVAIFLFATLYVGVRHGRGVKTIQDYALGGRNFSTFALVATIVATWVSGSGFFITLSEVYENGLYDLIPVSSMSIAFLIIAFVLVPRISIFLGKISVAEAMGELYGKQVRIITAIAGSISAAGFIAVQFNAFGNIFMYFTNIEAYYIIVLFGLIVTIYSVFGGIKGVTYTDILQFLAFFISIPILGFMLWKQVSNGETSFSFVKIFDIHKFDYKHVIDINNPKFLSIIPLLFYFAVPGLTPDIFQRISMGSNVSQVKKAFFITAIIILIIELAVSWIPFLIYNIDSGLNKKQLLSYIIDHYSFVGMTSLMLICVTAMSMSSADSNINITSVLLVHDISKTILGKIKHELLWIRISGAIIGIIAITLSIFAKNLLQLILDTQNFYIPVVTVPLIITILGFRTNRKCILTGMYGGIATVLIWKTLSVKGEVMPFAVLVNILLLFGSHYLSGSYGGWTHTECKYLDDLRTKRKYKLKKLISNIKTFNFLEFCRNNAPKNIMTYSWFGIYCIIYTITTMYSTQNQMSSDKSIILYFYQLMLCTGTLMASFPIWPYSINMRIKENIVQTWWPFAIFYMMFFFNMFFLLVSNFGQLQIFFSSINIIFAMFLVGWRVALAMLIIGAFSSIKIYQYAIGHIPTNILDSQYLFLYAIIILCVGTLIFIKQYQDKQELLKKKNIYLKDKVEEQRAEVARASEMKDEFLRNMQHESQTPMTVVYGHLYNLHNQYDIFDEATRREFISDAMKEATKFMHYTQNTQILAENLEKNITLNKEKVNLSDLIYDVIEVNKTLHINAACTNDRTWNIDVGDNVFAHCDKKYMRKAISNLVENAIKYCEKGIITIKLKKEDNNMLQFTISDEGCGLPEDELQEIFHAFMTSSATRQRSEGKGLGLAVARNVIELHQGTISAHNNKYSRGATFYFMLPIMM